MGGKVLDYPGRAMYFAGESDGYKKGRAEGRAEGEQRGIDETNTRVAQDMLRKNLPLTLITEISKLSEDIVRGIANSIGVSIKLS